MSQQTPIGLIVKELDNALTAYTNEAMVRQNVTRFHRQTLNLIKDAGRITYERLSETMKLCLDKDQLNAVVKDLTQRSWVRTTKDSSFILTDEGRKNFRIRTRWILAQNEQALSSFSKIYQRSF
jgi:hypothetical protein